ncbi:MAG TPA: hypothetical protein PLB55_14305 [Prosthecobacter sp.]|jgi:hypothetical protein|nr:hypothetical protein [Prosthecobacter sp.]
MISCRLRPRFTQVLDMGVDAARELIASGACRHEDRCEVKSFPGYVSLHVLEKDSQYWSPRLNLSLEPEPDGRTRVTGTYGPNANVWSAFLYGYLLVGSAGVFAGLLGLCQWWLGMTAWGLWIFFAMLGIAAGMCVMAQCGQKVGEQQTLVLHQVYEDVVGMRVDIG